LLSSTLYSAGGYITSTISKQAGEHNWPDLQFVLQGASVSDEYVAGIAEERCNTKPGLLAKYFNSSYGRYKYSFTLAPVLVRPKSRGWIKLQGKDPNLPLLINPNYLQHPDDLKVIIEGKNV
jgi:choline dehydrogenase-like flavoprotein